MSAALGFEGRKGNARRVASWRRIHAPMIPDCELGPIRRFDVSSGALLPVKKRGGTEFEWARRDWTDLFDLVAVIEMGLPPDCLYAVDDSPEVRKRIDDFRNRELTPTGTKWDAIFDRCDHGAFWIPVKIDEPIMLDQYTTLFSSTRSERAYQALIQHLGFEEHILPLDRSAWHTRNKELPWIICTLLQMHWVMSFAAQHKLLVWYDG